MEQKQWIKLLEAQADQIIAQVNTKQIPFLVGIGGRSAAGKTTISEILSRKTGWPVVHLDDFFL
ncbi:MAG: hypothetical protein IKF60_04770, partial [Solobacterium sp.]|nr:hypothetical protein [Solobacterium sp.]